MSEAVDDEDFEARQRASRERVLAFEQRQKEKKKQEQHEAMAAHYEAIEKKRLDTLAAVDAMHNSLSNSQSGGFFGGVSPEELMQDSDEEEKEKELAESAKSQELSKAEEKKQELSKAEQKKQELAALEARLQQQEDEKRAKIQAYADQQKASAEERVKARERLREQQRLEQQRLADEQINQAKAHMAELAAIAKEQQDRLIGLHTSMTAKKPATSGSDGTPQRPNRSSTYVTVRDSQGGNWDDDMSVNSRTSITDTKERTMRAMSQTDMDGMHFDNDNDDTKFQKFKPKGKRHSSYIDSQRAGNQRPDMDWQDPVALSHELRKASSLPITEEQDSDEESGSDSESDSEEMVDMSKKSIGKSSRKSKKKSSKRRKSSRKQKDSDGGDSDSDNDDKKMSASSRKSSSGRKPIRRQRSSSLGAMGRNRSNVARAKTAEPDFDWNAFKSGGNVQKKNRRSTLKPSATMGSASERTGSTRGRRNTTIAVPTRGLTRQRSSSLTDVKRGRKETSPSSKDSSSRRGRSRSASVRSRSRSRSKSRSSRKSTKSPPPKSLLDSSSKKTPSRGRLTRQRSSSLSELRVNRNKDKDTRRTRSRSAESRKNKDKDKKDKHKSEKKDKDKKKSHASSSSLGDDIMDSSSRRGRRERSKSVSGRHRSRSVSVSRRRGSGGDGKNNKSALGDRPTSSSPRRSRSRSVSVSRRSSTGKGSSKSALDISKEKSKEDDGAPKPRRRVTRQRSSSLSSFRMPRRERSRSVSSRKPKDSSSSRKSMLEISDPAQDNTTKDDKDKDSHDPHNTFYDWISHSNDAIGRLESRKAAMEERRKKKKLQRNALRALDRLKEKEKENLADFSDDDNADNDDGEQESDDEPDFGVPDFDFSITGKPRQIGGSQDESEAEVDMTEALKDEKKPLPTKRPAGQATKDKSNNSSGELSTTDKTEATADSTLDESSTISSKNDSKGSVGAPKQEAKQPKRKSVVASPKTKAGNQPAAATKKGSAANNKAPVGLQKGAKPNTQSKTAEPAKKEAQQGGKETKQTAAPPVAAQRRQSIGSLGTKDSKKADAAPSAPRRQSMQTTPKKGLKVSDPLPKDAQKADTLMDDMSERSDASEMGRSSRRTKKGLKVSDPLPKGSQKEDALMDDTSERSDASEMGRSSRRRGSMRGSILGKVMKNTKSLLGKGKGSSDATAPNDDSEVKEEIDTTKSSPEKTAAEKKKKPDLQKMDIDIDFKPTKKLSKGAAAPAKKLSKGAAAPAKKLSKGTAVQAKKLSKGGAGPAKTALEAMDIPATPPTKQNGKKGTAGAKTAPKGKGRGRPTARAADAEDASAPKRGVARQRSHSLSDMVGMVRGKIREGHEPKSKTPMPQAAPYVPDATDYEEEDYSESPLRLLDTYEDELTLEQLRAKVAKLEKQLKDTEEAEAREVEEVVQSARGTYGKISKKAEQVSNLPDDLSQFDEKVQRNNEIVKYLKAENHKRRDECQKIKTEFFDLHQNTMRLEKSTEQTLGYLEKLEDVYYQGEVDKRQRLLRGLAAYKEADETLTEEGYRRTAFVDCEKRLRELYEGTIANLVISLEENYHDTAFVTVMSEIAAGMRDSELVARVEGGKKRIQFVEGGDEKDETVEKEDPVVDEDERARLLLENKVSALL